MKMHGLTNPKFINAKQAGDIYSYTQPDRPRPTALLPPRSYGKAATAVDRLLMMGKRMPETC
jgi:hypothetical protein